MVRPLGKVHLLRRNRRSASSTKIPACCFFHLTSGRWNGTVFKKYFRLALGAKLSTCRLLLSVIQRRRSLEHVHVVARISWIRVMCWNLRECRPHPTYLLASVANVFACLSKMHAKVPVCFNFKWIIYKFAIIRQKNYKKSLLRGLIPQTSAEKPPKNGGVRNAN
jgi:hypothetical protein